MNDLPPEIEEMIKKQEELFEEKNMVDKTHLALNIKVVKLTEERNNLLNEILKEIRRLRVTGIQL